MVEDIVVILMVISAVFHRNFDDDNMNTSDDNCKRHIQKAKLYEEFVFQPSNFVAKSAEILSQQMIKDGDTSDDDKDQPGKAAHH